MTFADISAKYQRVPEGRKDRTYGKPIYAVQKAITTLGQFFLHA